MNPFLLKKKPVAGMIISRREPDEQPDQEPETDSIEYCAQDLIDAVHAKDPKAVAAALRDAFDHMEQEPHEEAPHEPEEQV